MTSILKQESLPIYSHKINLFDPLNDTSHFEYMKINGNRL